MITIINDLFGVYSPVVDTVTGSIVTGVSGLDVPYIFGGIIFCILLSGVLGCIKVLLNKL